MNKKILVIDDEVMITSTLKRLLCKSGYDVVIVNSGQNAIDACSNQKFDLIISDIRMPGMDGVETLKKIKECSPQHGQAKLPTIFITGYADEGLELKAKNLGYDDYIYKPFDLKTFLERVQTVLNEKG